MPTATITPPGPIMSASVTLTSAQVLAIFTTPVTVVPAPGVGLFVQPIVVTYDYSFASTAYTDNGGNLRIAVSGAGALAAFATAGFWDQTSSRFHSSLSTAWANTPVSSLANKAITVSQDTANPTLGNGTVTVTVAYTVVPVS